MLRVDATIVLSWLQSYPARWDTFVANRVSKIQDILPASQWSHVQSSENPADCASRGISPSELASHSLWWHGPSFLARRDFNVSSEQHFDERALLERRNVQVHYSLARTSSHCSPNILH